MAAVSLSCEKAAGDVAGEYSEISLFRGMAQALQRGGDYPTFISSTILNA